MKALAIPALGLVAALWCGCTTVETAPVQLGLFPPAQVFHEETDVRGLRLSALIGNNERVAGLDVAALAATVDADFAGVQLSGFANRVSSNATGVQIAAFANRVGAIASDGEIVISDRMVGVQIAAFNQGNLRGVQLGAGNGASEGAGLQVGALNVAERLTGVQLGVVNYCPGCLLPAFPGINVGYPDSDRHWRRFAAALSSAFRALLPGGGS